MIPFLKSEYFLSEDERRLFNTIHDFILKYNVPPTTDALKIEITSLPIQEAALNSINESLNQIITDTSETNLDWLLESTEKFCQEKAIYNAMMKSIDIMNGNNKNHSKGAIPSLLSDALAVTFDPNVGHDYLNQSDDRYDYYHRVQERLAFDLDFFNTITKGGLPKKTLNIALAGTGVGKSLFMCHVAASCLNMGRNVLYITMELAEEEVAKRIDANLLNTTFDDLLKLPKQIYQEKIERLKSNTNGKLIVKEYPTAGASVLHFKTLLNELLLKKSFKPDIIFIDYLNICMSARIKPGGNVNSYTYIKSIAEELRGMAVEHNVPVVSATQTTRTGFCLDLDTEVMTKNGTKKLSEVKVGDEVLSNKGYNTVKKLYPIQNKQKYLITTKSGKKIICTKEHRFPVEDYSEKCISTGLSVGEKLWIYK